MSAQRARSTVAAGHRSIHPNLPGVPWWAAVVIAVTVTAVGFAFDAGSGNKELTNVFVSLYVLGCVAAVLAVAQAGVFTAVVQPPLILFCAVPGANFLFHGAKFTGVKDLLINCGYPLIERFPLMLFTTAGVLLIGMGRWFFGMASAHSNSTGAPSATGETGLIAALTAKLTSIRGDDSADQDDRADQPAAAGSQPRRNTERPARATKRTGTSRSTKRVATPRSRYGRPPLDDTPQPPSERPRRRRPVGARGMEPNPEVEARPRRRPRPPHDESGPYGEPPREVRRRDPGVGGGRATDRGSRYESAEPYQPPRARGRPIPKEAIGANGTHHPVSRVRYRGAEANEEIRAQTRPSPRRPDADSWKYDV